MTGRWHASGLGTGVHTPGLLRRQARRVLPVHELIAVQSGTVPIAEQDRRFAVPAGDWLLLRAGRRHHGYDDLSTDTWFYWVCFPDTHASSFRTSQAWEQQIGTLARPSRLRSLFEAMLEDQSAAILNSIAAAGYVQLMLSEVLLQRTTTAPATEVNALAPRARAFVDANLGDPDLGTARIADALSYSADHLGRTFRAAAGESLTEHIHRRRVDRARALLRSTDLPVERIAAQVGFRDPRYFRRVFKRRVGLTPGQFRHRHPHP